MSLATFPSKVFKWCYIMTWLTHMAMDIQLGSVQTMFAIRRPLLPSFLSLVSVTKVLRYFNVMLFSCRYQANIANQMVNIFHKWSLLDVASDKSRLSKVFHRELSIILSHVSVTSNDWWVVIVKWSGPLCSMEKCYIFQDFQDRPFKTARILRLQ